MAPSEVDLERYAVEVLLAARRVALPVNSRDGRTKEQKKGTKYGWEYFVKWYNYGSVDNSWEPEAGLVGGEDACNQLLERFWENIEKSRGVGKNSNLPLDSIVKPTDDWIEDEKMFFLSTDMNGPQEQSESDSDEETDQESVLNLNTMDSSPRPSRGSDRNSQSLRIRIPCLKRKVGIVSDDTSVQYFGISTKERLAKEALSLLRPDAIFAPPRGECIRLPSPIQMGSSSQMALGFKKKICSATEHQPTLAALNAVFCPKKNYITPLQQGIGPPYIAPDIGLDEQDSMMMDVDSSGFGELDGSQLGYLTELLPPAIETDNFLHDIMPAVFAASSCAAIDEVPSSESAALVATTPVPLEFGERRKWLWSGNIYIESHHDPSELLCTITFCDETEPSSMEMNFGAVLHSFASLYVSTFHNLVDVPIILQACQDARQFARLVPQDAEVDVENFKAIRTYMIKHQKVILMPASISHENVGNILVFPPIRTLCKQLNVPFSIYAPNSTSCVFLIAALVPWHLSPAQVQKSHRRLPSVYLPANIDFKIEPMFSDEARWRHSILRRPRYHQGLRILGFPASIHGLLSQPENNMFNVWWYGGDGSKDWAGIETHLLFEIMKDCNEAQRRKFDSDAKNDIRVIFVHVGALKTVHRLPGLAKLSLQTTLFWTYGTHISIEPELWGMREIFTCGGIVTFTPEAIINNHAEVLEKIQQIHEHPLWECYVLPSVLGMVLMANMFEKEKSLPTDLFTAIGDGKIALMTAPHLGSCTSKAKSDRQQRWIQNHWTRRPQDEWSILQVCTNSYQSAYGGAPGKGEALAALKREISRDLRLMRQHPAFMVDYRRYVVLDSEFRSFGDGLEWTTLDEFDFKDDFFSPERNEPSSS